MDHIQYKCRLAIQFLGIFPNDGEEVVEQQHHLHGTLLEELCMTVLLSVKAVVYAILFVPKEILFSLFAYIDMFVVSTIFNFILFHLKNLGRCRDRSYVDGHKLFSVRGTETRAGRSRVAIRILAIWFAIELLKSSMDISVTEAIDNISPLWKSPKIIEWKDGMEITTFMDNTVSKRHYPLSKEEPPEIHPHRGPSPCVQVLRNCIASKLPRWLFMSNMGPNPILCNVCNRFLTGCECYQDMEELPDAALATHGSRVIGELTSPTFQGGLFTILKQRRPSPITAILPWEEPGECWPMAGRNGSLGVELSQPVSVKAISIDSSDHPLGLASAPADFEVWGLIHYHDEDDRSWKYPWDSFESMVDNNVLFLGRFTYNSAKGPAVQTFAIGTTVALPPIKTVVFRFLNNWGRDDYTCIYRVRVHGGTY